MSKKPVERKFKAILFDLGKVIFYFNFEPAFRRLAARCSKTPKEIEDYFVVSGLEVLYDGGKISSLNFYRAVKKALGLRMSYAGFRRAWCDIFTPIPETLSLIRRLKTRYRLVLISNTNAMHFEYLKRRYAIFKLFDRHILSYEEKRRKPDHRLYHAAIRACRAEAREIFYVDDRPDLTEAAHQIGLEVFTYKNNPRDLADKMKALSIL